MIGHFGRLPFLAMTLGACLATGASAAQPETDRGRFDVYFAGLKAGELRYAMTLEGGQYAGSGRVDSTGLIAAIADFRFKAEVRGHVRASGLQPAHYEETSDTGRRRSDKVIAYRRGVPQVVRDDAPEDHGLDPASQGDALDPLTAFWQVLRDRSRDDLCRLDLAYFDGTRRIRLTTTEAETRTGKVACAGRYIREGGFSRKAMKEGQVFPFDLTYAPTRDGLWSVTHIEVQTLRGRALLVRR